LKGNNEAHTVRLNCRHVHSPCKLIFRLIFYRAACISQRCRVFTSWAPEGMGKRGHLLVTLIPPVEML